jgi:hypothetical protein
MAGSCANRTAVNGPGPEWAPTSSKHGPLNEDLYGSTSPGVTDNQSAIGGLTEGTNLGVGRKGQANCSHDSDMCKAANRPRRAALFTLA